MLDETLEGNVFLRTGVGHRRWRKAVVAAAVTPPVVTSAAVVLEVSDARRTERRNK